MRVLLDTNILAELVKADGNPAVKSALDEIPSANVFLSVLAVGEIVKGIPPLGSGRKKQQLTKRLAGLEQQYAERVLPLDIETAYIWGELTARAQQSGVIIPPTDGLLNLIVKLSAIWAARAAGVGSADGAGRRGGGDRQVDGGLPYVKTGANEAAPIGSAPQLERKQCEAPGTFVEMGSRSDAICLSTTPLHRKCGRASWR